MKMTIREAFEKHKDIAINYVFETKCRECGKYFNELDYEFSFEWNLEEFKEWLTHYNVIDLDYDEIEQLEGEECKFVLYRMSPDEGLCESCEKEKEEKMMVVFAVPLHNPDEHAGIIYKGTLNECRTFCEEALNLDEFRSVNICKVDGVIVEYIKN